MLILTDSTCMPVYCALSTFSLVHAALDAMPTIKASEPCILIGQY